jgi:protein-disulfide isomerase
MSTLKLAVNSNDHHQGDATANITLVEYGDFQCPHCRLAHPLIKRLLKERGDDLNFVFRNFPLQEIHHYAYAAAIVAEVAGKQGKVWEMHDLIFENQERLNNDYLLTLAQELKLDMKRFAEDFKSKDIQTKIETDFESGIRSGVNGTPSFFINGAKLLTYDETYESLEDAIQLENEMKLQKLVISE